MTSTELIMSIASSALMVGWEDVFFPLTSQEPFCTVCLNMHEV